MIFFQVPRTHGNWGKSCNLINYETFMILARMGLLKTEKCDWIEILQM